jgi:hypothetical protein
VLVIRLYQLAVVFFIGTPVGILVARGTEIG